jgi:hypothetical protein
VLNTESLFLKKTLTGIQGFKVEKGKQKMLNLLCNLLWTHSSRRQNYWAYIALNRSNMQKCDLLWQKEAEVAYREREKKGKN